MDLIKLRLDWSVIDLQIFLYDLAPCVFYKIIQSSSQSRNVLEFPNIMLNTMYHITLNIPFSIPKKFAMQTMKAAGRERSLMLIIVIKVHMILITTFNFMEAIAGNKALYVLMLISAFQRGGKTNRLKINRWKCRLYCAGICNFLSCALLMTALKPVFVNRCQETKQKQKNTTQTW